MNDQEIYLRPYSFEEQEHRGSKFTLHLVLMKVVMKIMTASGKCRFPGINHEPILIQKFLTENNLCPTPSKLHQLQLYLYHMIGWCFSDFLCFELSKKQFKYWIDVNYVLMQVAISYYIENLPMGCFTPIFSLRCYLLRNGVKSFSFPANAFLLHQQADQW